jgi:protein-disulfide isomerase
VRAKGSPGLGARQASPRALAIAGGVILLVILAVVLAIVLSQKSSGATGNADPNGDGPTIGIPPGYPGTGSSSRPGAILNSSDVANEFKNIPQKGFVLGQANAPVTLVEYIDLQCPVCRDFELNEMPILLTKYVQKGKLKVEMKTWNIIDANHPGTDDSLRGQKVTIAAAKQDKAFTFAQLLYNNQGTEGTSWLTNAQVAEIAAGVDGLNLSQLETDANSSETSSLIKSIDTYANAQADEGRVTGTGAFAGTPTLLLAKGNGKPQFYISSEPDLASLEAKINALLK